MRFVITILIIFVSLAIMHGQTTTQKRFRGKIVAFDALLASENPSAIPFVEMYLLKLNGSDKIVRLKLEYPSEPAKKGKSLRENHKLINVTGIRDKECDSILRNIVFAQSTLMGTNNAGPPILRLEYMDIWRPSDLSKEIRCYKINASHIEAEN